MESSSGWRLGRWIAPAGALVLLCTSVPDRAAGDPAPDQARLTGELIRLPEGAFASERTLTLRGRARARRIRLDRPVRGFLVGTNVPWARFDHHRKRLAYETWAASRQLEQEPSLEEQGVRPGGRLGSPRLRVRVIGGAEHWLERGSISPSFRRDGPIAYAVGRHRFLRSQRPFLTNIRVRRSLRARPRTWSTNADRYTVLGWAGRRLVVSRRVPAEFPEVIVFDGPGRMRSLGDGTSLLAIRPDGKALLLAINGGDRQRLELVRARDGVRLAAIDTLSLGATAAGTPSRFFFGPADWYRDLLAVTTDNGIAILRVSRNRLELVHSFGVTGGRPLQGPRFVGTDADVLTAWSSGGGDDSHPRPATLYRCTWNVATCTSRKFAATALPRPVFDLSAPR